MISQRSRIVVFALVACGSLAFAQGTFEKAVQDGRRALGERRYEDALRFGKTAANLESKRYEGFLIVGRAAYQLDLADRAVGALTFAHRFAPNKSKPAIASELEASRTLVTALKWVALAEKEEKSAAPAYEAAYKLVPRRTEWAKKSARAYEIAGQTDESLRILKLWAKSDPGDSVQKEIASLQERIATNTRLTQEAENERIAAEERRRTREEDKRARAAEEKRLAEEEKRRIEEEKRQDEIRREEERRAREEQERLNREEVARLGRALEDFRRSYAATEQAIRRADADVDDAERDVRTTDYNADRARDRRNEAKRKRDDLRERLEKANDLGKEVLKGELRTAQAALEDAQEEVEKANRRFARAKDRRDEIRNAASQFRQQLDRLRQEISDTESAIRRLGG